MGLKSIVNYLNDRAIRTRNGGPFGITAVHQILTRETYIGRHHFNARDYKTKARKPEAEHTIIAVPPIISEDDFKEVREILTARSPRWTPTRHCQA